MANKAKRTPSGSWRVQVFDFTDASGKRHYKSITAPSKVVAEARAAEFARTKATRATSPAGTVGALVERYIREAEPVLSPSTITAYRKVSRHAFPELMATPLSRVNASVVQRAINSEVSRAGERTGRPLSAKTIRNEWGLVSAALSELAGLSFSPKLPAYQVAPKRLPEPSEVMAAVRGSSIELPVLLALCLSLTLSEIRGLRWDDIDGDVLTVRRVVVDTERGPVEKPTGKTSARLRTLVLPPFLAAMINESRPDVSALKTANNGLVVPLTGNAIYLRFRRLMKSAGLSITFHGLRALNASVMLARGVPDKYAMQRGGWASPSVMKRNYQNTLDATRAAVDADINGYFEGLFNVQKCKKLHSE